MFSRFSFSRRALFRGAGEGEEEQRIVRQAQAVQQELRRPGVDVGEASSPSGPERPPGSGPPGS